MCLMKIQKELRDKLRKFLRFLDYFQHFTARTKSKLQKRAFPLHECIKKIRYFRNMIQKVVNIAMKTKVTEDALFST